MDHHQPLRNIIAASLVRGIGPAFFKRNLEKLRELAFHGSDFDSFEPVLGARVSRVEWLEHLAVADHMIERCDNLGISALSVIDQSYPTKLLELSKPPSIVFCLGNVELLKQTIVTVIGTRNPSRLGGIAAERIGKYLNSKGVSICNGLANGVDACSIVTENEYHFGTIGVLASGLDFQERNLVSKSVSERASRVLDVGGLIISEGFPGVREDTYSVISSCRIQAGLADTMVLVQSSMSGGSRFAVSAFCALSRALVYVDPPVGERHIEEFSANLALSLDGAEGLKKFADVKEVKTSSILPVRSRADYANVFERIGQTSGAVL